jgi:hypothetical protein
VVLDPSEAGAVVVAAAEVSASDTVGDGDWRSVPADAGVAESCRVEVSVPVGVSTGDVVCLITGPARPIEVAAAGT